MLKRSVRKYIFNPIMGMLPLVLYLVLDAFAGLGTLRAISIPLFLSIVSEWIIRRKYATKMYSLTFFVSSIALVLTLLFWLITRSIDHYPCAYIIFCEIMVVFGVMLIRASKIYISTLFFRKKSGIQKAWLNEFYHLATLIQYALTAHLLLLLVCANFGDVGLDYRKSVSDLILFVIIPIVLLIALGVYHIFRTTNLIARLKKEEWLPIVTEKGEVTGKIAKSVSLKMKNKFLHPIVRVALVADGKVYLQERVANDLIDAGKLDYPFEKYMLFNHEINLAARNSISQMMGNKIDIPLKFLLKYVFENEETKRLILLFVANLDDETEVRRTNKMNGKFWTVKQIEEAFADDVLSETFTLEFEYLKNTVLHPID